jgi:hypothetical protein
LRRLPKDRTQLLAPRLLAAVLLTAAISAQAVEVLFERVADGVYAVVVETGARTEANEGLDANLGLVVTPAGALLINSGGTFQAAPQVHEAVQCVTGHPVRGVRRSQGLQRTPLAAAAERVGSGAGQCQPGLP